MPAGFVAVAVPVNEQRPGPDLLGLGWRPVWVILGGHAGSHDLGEVQPPFCRAGLRVGEMLAGGFWKVGEDDGTRGFVES